MAKLPQYPDSVAELLEKRVCSESVTQSLLAGDQCIRDGNFDSARKHYQRALEEKDDCYDAMAGLEYVEYLISGRQSRYQWPIRRVPSEIHQLRNKNYLLNLEEYKSRQTRLKSRPPMGYIEPTTKCNFKCPHCTKGYFPYYGADIEKDLALSAIDQLLPCLNSVCITGFGEPTISKSYNAIMARLAQNQVFGLFSTNTSTMTLPHIESLVKCNASVVFSVDGATRKTFETIRLGGNWDRFLHALHLAKRIRCIHPAQEQILPTSREFRITFVLMQMNVHELSDMVRLVHAFEFDNMTVHDYQSVGGVDFDMQSPRFEPQKANAALEEAESIGKNLGVNLRLPGRYVEETPPPGDRFWMKVWKALKKGQLFPERKRFPSRCYHPWSDTAIMIDGKVTPCCFSSSKMGNLKEQSFDQIWNGWRYRWFRRRIDSFFPPFDCRNCHVTEGISRGNPGATKSKEGLLLKILYHFEFRLRGIRKIRDKGCVANYFKGKRWNPENQESVDDVNV